MPSSLYEIVELSNGSVVLRQLDDQDKPLVTITLSGDAEKFLGAAKMDVLRAMIEAGFEAISELSEENEALEADADSDKESSESIHSDCGAAVTIH